ncbi:ParB N-terminal domain-containing protein, partial [Burkholderia ubonensis]|uniref:ParB N-terminal domain-containing protein n=1 Tax=Burkholderia ubonensis TaxID=101571 RepID=UPI0018E02EEB
MPAASAADEYELSDSEYQRVWQILNELEVPSLDFLFYDESLEEEAQPWNSESATPQKGEATDATAETTLAVQTLRRPRRNAQFSSDNIPQQILALQAEELKKNRYIARITDDFFTLVKHSKEVRDSESWSNSGRNVIYLLKSIEVISAYIEKLTGPLYGSRDFFRPLLDGLWRIADGLTDEYSKIKVTEFKRTFLIDSAPSQTPALITTEPPATKPTIPPDVWVENIERHGELALKQLEESYSLILDPVAFIDDYIKTRVSRYEQETGKRVNLTPDSKITVTVRDMITNQEGDYRDIVASIKTHHFTLKEFVTGQHWLYFKSDSKYRYKKVEFESPEIDKLVRDLVGDIKKHDDLQSEMERALSNYRAKPANRENLTSHYRGMIIQRCLEYLDSPTSVPLYKQAVEKFLDGQVQAMEVLFKGSKLNGVFWIPVDDLSGVLFSVDERGFFHVGRGSQRHAGRFNKWNAYEPVSSFPGTDAFKQWVLNKIPSQSASQYANSAADALFKTDVRWQPWFGTMSGVGSDKIVERPFSFAASDNTSDLANKLFDGLMDRLSSDIDSLVYTERERMTEAGLEILKSILMIGSMLLNIAVPGSGALLGRITLFLANLAIDAAYVVAAMAQAENADRPDDAAAYRNDALIGGILGGVAGVAGGVPLARQGAKEALASYRQIKAAAGTAIPSLMKKLNWSRLTSARKYELLVEAVERSDDALELVRLTGSKDAVSQTIRKSRPAQIVWKEFDAELVSVRSELKEEVARVKQLASLSTPGGELRRVFSGSQSEALPEAMQLYLQELRETPDLADTILQPWQDLAAIPDVANFMRTKGMENIRYRGMYIWANGMDETPVSHFVVLGDRNGKTYAFDLTAGQFANRGMPSLAGPLILPESAWAQRYQRAATTQLVKYKDFDSFADARDTFRSINSQLPTESIGGASVLADPHWYKVRQARSGNAVKRISGDFADNLGARCRAKRTLGSLCKPIQLTEEDKERLLNEGGDKWAEHEKDFIQKNKLYAVEMDVVGKKETVVYYMEDGAAYRLDDAENLWGYQREYDYESVLQGDGARIRSWKSKPEGDTFLRIKDIDVGGMGNLKDWKQKPIETGIKGGDFIEPVDVRQLSDGRYELVNGRNRYEVAQRLGLTHLPVKIEPRLGPPPLQAPPLELPRPAASPRNLPEPSSTRLGLVRPSRPSQISQERATEVENLAASVDEGYLLDKSPEQIALPPGYKDWREIKYYTDLISYRKREYIWKTNLAKGRAKYKEFYEDTPEIASKADEFKNRYEKYTESTSAYAPYIDEKGAVQSPAASEITLDVIGNHGRNPLYRFRVSDSGEVLVVDNMSGNVDKVTPGKGSALRMNELQGEFIKLNEKLLKNIKYINQENIANDDTKTLLDSIFGRSWARDAAKKPIILTPTGPWADEFRAMLNTPNVQPTARMLSTYPEIDKKIVEIRIQGVDRITLVLGPRSSKWMNLAGLGDALKNVKEAETDLIEAVRNACGDSGLRVKRSPALCKTIDLAQIKNKQKAEAFYNSNDFKEVRESLQGKYGNKYDEKVPEIKQLLESYGGRAAAKDATYTRKMDANKLKAYLVHDLEISDIQKKYMTESGLRKIYSEEIGRNRIKYWEGKDNRIKPAEGVGYTPTEADRAGQITMYRTMPEDEAKSILSGELHKLKGHMGDLKQAMSYFDTAAEAAEASNNQPKVVMKFTFGPGKHVELFSPENLAVAPSGEGAALIHGITQHRANKGVAVLEAAGGEGHLAGYIGVKSENRGEGISFTIGKGEDHVASDKLKSLLESAEVIHGPEAMQGQRIVFNARLQMR